MSNNTPSFDYEGAIKESPRKSAKWHFERKPYEIAGINVEEHIKKRSGASGTNTNNREREKKRIS